MKACIALLVSLFALSVGQSLYTDSPLHFFPFGEFNGDTVWDERADDGNKFICFPFALFGKMEADFYLSNNGYLTFGGVDEGENTYKPNLHASTLPTIAPFWTDLKSSEDGGGLVYYRIVDDNSTKSIGQNLIRAAFDKPHFEVQSMFVATFDGVKGEDGDFSWYTFQVALIAGCDESVVVFNYGDLEMSYDTTDEEEGEGKEEVYPIQMGYSSGCDEGDEGAEHVFVHGTSETPEILELNKGSNLEVNGKALKGQYAYVVSAGASVTPVLITPANKGYSVDSPVITGMASCNTQVDVEIDGEFYATTVSDSKGNFVIKKGPKVKANELHTVSATTEGGNTATHTFKTKKDGPLKLSGGGSSDGTEVFFDI